MIRPKHPVVTHPRSLWSVASREHGRRLCSRCRNQRPHGRVGCEPDEGWVHGGAPWRFCLRGRWWRTPTSGHSPSGPGTAFHRAFPPTMEVFEERGHEWNTVVGGKKRSLSDDLHLDGVARCRAVRHWEHPGSRVFVGVGHSLPPEGAAVHPAHLWFWVLVLAAPRGWSPSKVRCIRADFCEDCPVGELSVVSGGAAESSEHIPDRLQDECSLL